MPSIQKLNEKIIALQKKICGLPNCTPNVTIQIPHNCLGMEAFSIYAHFSPLTLIYLCCFMHAFKAYLGRALISKTKSTF